MVSLKSAKSLEKQNSNEAKDPSDWLPVTL